MKTNTTKSVVVEIIWLDEGLILCLQHVPVLLSWLLFSSKTNVPVMPFIENSNYYSLMLGRDDDFRFGLVFIKKHITKLNSFKPTGFGSGSNRFWFCFFPFWFGFFRFGSVWIRFGFFGFKLIKPKLNRTGRFFQNFNRFFLRFGFFNYFFLFFSV